MERAAAGDDLVRELRTFAGEIEHYIGEMSHHHTMHRSDLTALAHVMDGHEVTPKDVSEALGLSASATSALLDRLERAGHVTRSRSTVDRRSIHLEVTDTAREVGSSIFTPLAMHVRQVLARHGTDELERTAALLAELNTAVRAARRDVRAMDPPQER
ncbi:transcriptional regulator, MarR family [Aeromicrobium marinum DSM 15272]|uniref:Transcriptional regulator, MarR family n=1 Tax=Aeromicrobium marinum DSM 15272 TaxID=585531 RepID=E2S980_9ACTN|nr:MarR family transcriptional regulator [Aeromicrobium marinum]EFQ83804.1 transcriptional regulator, MarR family [Aeromicrobium marinum DSM 15272]